MIASKLRQCSHCKMGFPSHVFQTVLSFCLNYNDNWNSDFTSTRSCNLWISVPHFPGSSFPIPSVPLAVVKNSGRFHRLVFPGNCPSYPFFLPSKLTPESVLVRRVVTVWAPETHILRFEPGSHYSYCVLSDKSLNLPQLECPHLWSGDQAVNGSGRGGG